MNVNAPTSPGPGQESSVPLCSGDETKKADIAHALWTEIHWLMPKDRTVSITVDGDHIAVAFGPPPTDRRFSMKLLTEALREQLLSNGRNRDQDHAPPLKLFNPCGAATWLFSELDEDGDTLFGLADLGFGTPELGYSSLREISSIRLSFGLGIERDLHFRPKHPLSVYTQAARDAGRIVEYGPELDAAANSRKTIASARTERPAAPSHPRR